MKTYCEQISTGYNACADVNTPLKWVQSIMFIDFFKLKEFKIQGDKIKFSLNENEKATAYNFNQTSEVVIGNFSFNKNRFSHFIRFSLQGFDKNNLINELKNSNFFVALRDSSKVYVFGFEYGFEFPNFDSNNISYSDITLSSIFEKRKPYVLDFENAIEIFDNEFQGIGTVELGEFSNDFSNDFNI